MLHADADADADSLLDPDLATEAVTVDHASLSPSNRGVEASADRTSK
ncbi:hypothetical protein PRUPE_5G222300 [Prunus persica]|uniref:Uncharacterized protein n=1 Tax=Prunus persica TaxID=3760 RepID=A0A251PC82_PRUPE|nr:hypothetical protein PRUPE_5G222300 [Prunus persica]